MPLASSPGQRTRLAMAFDKLGRYPPFRGGLDAEMELVIEEAVTYPYRDGQWKKTILMPGLIGLGGAFLQIVVMGVMVLLMVPMAVISSEKFASSPQFAMVNGLYTLVSMAITFLYAPCLTGFFWEALQVMKRGEGPTALPEWSGNWGYFWKVGIKLYCYKLLVGAPFLVLGVVMSVLQSFGDNVVTSLMGMLGGVAVLLLYGVYFFLMPFLAVPVVRNSPDCTFAGMLDVEQMKTVGKAHYSNVLLVMLLILLISFIYGIGGMVMGVLTCCIGFLFLPLLSMPMMLTGGHLLLQAYRDQDSEPLKLEDNLP